jgi:transmembrane sensor
MNIHERMDELLIKQLLNEATPDEFQQVAAWRAVNKDNEKYYQDFKTIWDTSKHLKEETIIDENQAWNRFRERVTHSEEDVADSVAFYPQRKRLSWIKAAAAVLVVGGGLFALNSVWSNKEITLVSNDKVLIDTLPDGSVVTLNKHSSLVYAKDFNETKRDVLLKGEAFFNVAPNKQKPFEIKVGEVNVHVVGTSFNVKEELSQTEVIVETGIVKVSVADEFVKLLPKEKVVVRKNNKKLDVTKSEDLLYNYYRTKTFECNNTPLYELVVALNKTYDTQIVIANENTKRLRMTTTFRDMPLNDILKVITETFNLSIEQHEGKITLK